MIKFILVVGYILATLVFVVCYLRNWPVRHEVLVASIWVVVTIKFPELYYSEND